MEFTITLSITLSLPAHNSDSGQQSQQFLMKNLKEVTFVLILM